MQYNYDFSVGEFVENPSGKEDNSITGNRVIMNFIEDSPGCHSPRFHIEIDDFGTVIAALNRLVQKITPTFIFPETNRS